MKPFQSGGTSTLRINIHLLTAFGCGFAAWAMWPRSIEWWGLGVLSMLCGATAIIETVKALRLMASRRNKERALADYAALGGKPKSSRLASNDDLRRWGMVDD